jgi:hypothetical protein
MDMGFKPVALFSEESRDSLERVSLSFRNLAARKNLVKCEIEIERGAPWSRCARLYYAIFAHEREKWRIDKIERLLRHSFLLHRSWTDEIEHEFAVGFLLGYCETDIRTFCLRIFGGLGLCRKAIYP